MPTFKNAQEELDYYKAENEKLKAEAVKNSKLSMKISEKGALSVYGLGRFPVTLYKEQWKRLFDYMATIMEFLKVNDSKLRAKGDPVEEKKAA